MQIFYTYVELPFFGKNVSSSCGGGGTVFACKEDNDVNDLRL